MMGLLIVFLIFQNPPNIENWEEITKTHYEVKNSLKVENETIISTSAIGLMRVLKNPEENEYVFVVSKYSPKTFLPQSTKNNQNSRDEIIISENYFQKTKLEKLKEVTENSDAILYVKWREDKDSRTGEKILVSSIENWLLKPNGEWIFEKSEKPILKVELVSEEQILVGFKFYLGEHYQILRFDQNQFSGDAK